MIHDVSNIKSQGKEKKNLKWNENENISLKCVRHS